MVVSMHTVSVIIPAYNSAKIVRDAIDSALAQTHQPVEILVIDDGSRDNTAEVVAAYPPPVRLLRKANGGPASARNLGARVAQGKWLAMLDADDTWAPKKLERQLACVTEDNIAIVHGPANHLLQVPAEISFEQLWAQNWIVNSSCMIRRDVFEALGGFDEERQLICVEDYNLWLRIAAAGHRIVTCCDSEAMTNYTKGIGISSNIPRMFHASMFNICKVAKDINVTPSILYRKKLELYEFFGKAALYERELKMARGLLRQAFLMRPSLHRLIYLLASYVPSSLLNKRRDLMAGARDETH